MIELLVRDARCQEAGFVMEMTREMIVDMERYGGRKATTDESAWDKIAIDIEEELRGEKSKFLIAETGDSDRIGLAAIGIIPLGGAFAPKKIIHLRLVYVLPSFRGIGVGSKLISAALDWGRRVGGDFCDLNVLARNPARSLYEKFGFSEVAVNMMKSL